MGEPILIPVSAGELLDKLSILEIKRVRLSAPDKLANVEREYGLLRTIAHDVRSRAPEAQQQVQALSSDLQGVNERLWDLENRVRAFERDSDFGADFAASARAIYSNNDLRASLKRQLNALLGSDLVEEKEHAVGRGPG